MLPGTKKNLLCLKGICHYWKSEGRINERGPKNEALGPLRDAMKQPDWKEAGAVWESRLFGFALGQAPHMVLPFGLIRVQRALWSPGSQDYPKKKAPVKGWPRRSPRQGIWPGCVVLFGGANNRGHSVCPLLGCSEKLANSWQFWL